MSELKAQEKPPTGWIGTAQAATMLGITQRWVQKLVEQGKLTGWRVNPKLLLVSQKSVEEYQRSQ